MFCSKYTSDQNQSFRSINPNKSNVLVLLIETLEGYSFNHWQVNILLRLSTSLTKKQHTLLKIGKKAASPGISERWFRNTNSCYCILYLAQKNISYIWFINNCQSGLANIFSNSVSWSTGTLSLSIQKAF